MGDRHTKTRTLDRAADHIISTHKWLVDML